MPEASQVHTFRFVVRDISVGWNHVDLRPWLPQTGFTPREIRVEVTTASGGGATPVAVAASVDETTMSAAGVDVYVGAGAGTTMYLLIRN